MSKPAVKSVQSATAKTATRAVNIRQKVKAPKQAKPEAKGRVRPSKDKPRVEIKKALHPRNAHLNGYDFPALISAFPRLKTFVRPTPYGALSVDFADPLAVKTLNAARYSNITMELVLGIFLKERYVLRSPVASIMCITWQIC